MKTRVAWCGHEYQVPDEFWGGRRRKMCEACLAACTTLSEAKRAQRLAIQAKRAADARWDRAPLAPRKARCGHEVPYHPGPPRKACEACSTRPPRHCAGCGASLAHRATSAKYCSTTCGQIARGERLPEPLPRRRCALPECGAEFQPKRRGQRCCCERHGKILCNREGRASGRYVDPWNDRRRNNYHRRRALKKGASTGRPVKLADIAERDGWRCGVCRRRVNPRFAWPHPKSPSLDHIVPLSEGGKHDPANVRLAHLKCNSERGNRGGGEQLLLFG